MHVSLLEWIVTLAATIAVLLFDVVVMARGSDEPTMRRSALGLSAYCGLAVCFGIWTRYFHGRQFAVQFFAGWVTEYSLSIDNLFIFVIIMTSFAVPRAYQRQALFAGIVIALIFRGIFIALGAAAIARFSWVFYIFGAFLLSTAPGWARGVTHETDAENAVVRFARNHLNVTETWHGAKLFVNDGSRRAAPQMALVVHALCTTYLIFALDSIPAIYGLTSEPYLVLAANVFALMGLRQLYFIVEGLLQLLLPFFQRAGGIFFFIAGQ